MTTLTIPSPVGSLTLVSEGEALTGVYFEGFEPADATREGSPAVLEEAASQLRAWFAGDRHDFDLPLAPRGTDFQRQVWRELQAIPYGELRGYGEIARRIGRPGASRAVGLANGRNPLAIVVPCHRVVGSDGRLVGYGGGLERKRWLLEHEAAHSR